MNFPRKRTSLLFLAAYAFLSLLSGCKSAVRIPTNAMVGAGKSKMENEKTPVKPEDKLKRGETQSINQRAIMALQIMKENAPKVRLNEYFNAIANADNTASADIIITKALALFASSTTPVLMEIQDQNGNSNHDKSTTILVYFNYLKTQKKNLDDIKNLRIDAYGKIIEVELTKNNSIQLP